MATSDGVTRCVGLGTSCWHAYNTIVGLICYCIMVMLLTSLACIESYRCVLLMLVTIAHSLTTSGSDWLGKWLHSPGPAWDRRKPLINKSETTRTASVNLSLPVCWLHPSGWGVIDVFARLNPTVSLFGHRNSSPSTIVHFRSNLWNGPPDKLTSLKSQLSFRRQLKPRTAVRPLVTQLSDVIETQFRCLPLCFLG